MKGIYLQYLRNNLNDLKCASGSDLDLAKLFSFNTLTWCRDLVRWQVASYCNVINCGEVVSGVLLHHLIGRPQPLIFLYYYKLK